MAKTVFRDGRRHFESEKILSGSILFASRSSALAVLNVLRSRQWLSLENSKTVSRTFSRDSRKFYGKCRRFAKKFFKKNRQTLLFLEIRGLQDRPIKMGGRIKIQKR
jgi:hypothetical protein